MSIKFKLLNSTKILLIISIFDLFILRKCINTYNENIKICKMNEIMNRYMKIYAQIYKHQYNDLYNKLCNITQCTLLSRAEHAYFQVILHISNKEMFLKLDPIIQHVKKLNKYIYIIKCYFLLDQE